MVLFDEVAEAARARRAHTGFVAREQEQPVGVAAHPARGLLQLGQAGRLGVELRGLQPLQQLDVPVEPGLQPPRDAGGRVVATTIPAALPRTFHATIAGAGVPAVGARSGSEVLVLRICTRITGRSPGATHRWPGRASGRAWS